MDDTDRPYTLTLQERSGYLYAHIKADNMTREVALRYLTEIADKCAELNCKTVALERDIPVMMNSTDVFFTAQDLAKLIRGVRVAVINPHPENEEALNFAMTVGNNRGAIIEIHKTLASAEKWLLRDLTT